MDQFCIWIKRGALFIISGESGVGKSNLIKGLIRFTELTGGLVLQTECFAEVFTPYFPLAEIIRFGLFSRGTPPVDLLSRDALNVQLPDSILADLVTLAPELRLALPNLPVNQMLDGQKEQTRLFESAVAFFTQLQIRQPVMVVIENAHWADGGT